MRRSSRSRRRSSTTIERRTTPACKNCSKSKIKCIGTPPVPCNACKGRKECVYPRTQGRKYVPAEDYQRDQESLLELKALVKAVPEGQLKSVLEAHKSLLKTIESKKSLPEDHTSSSRSEADAVEDDDDDEGEEPDYEGETFHFSRSGEHYLIGNASSTYLFLRLNRSTEAAAVDFDPQYSSWPKREPAPRALQLPPKSLAAEWYRKQYAFIGTIFSFAQPRDFQARLNRVYSRPAPDTSSGEDCLVFCQVLLCLGFGQLYYERSWSKDGPPGFGLFKDALYYLPDVHEPASTLFVEVLSLVGHYFQILNRRDAAFHYIGLALRMAISLGLHREVVSSQQHSHSHSPMIADDEREHRRRVWWSVYSLDRILTVKSGHPITVHDEDMDVALPTYHPDLDAGPLPSRILAHYTQLSTILGRIWQDIYRPRQKSGAHMLTAARAIMGDLAAWFADLPRELRLDLDRLDAPAMSREAVSTYLHYYQCVNMAARPFLFSVARRRLLLLTSSSSSSSPAATATWQSGYSASVVGVIEASIAAARDVARVAHAATNHELFATYGYMDNEHAFSAALTLVVVAIAFAPGTADADADAADDTDDHDQAMRLAMSVLQRAADRGNRHVGARHRLLRDLLAAHGWGDEDDEDGAGGTEFVVGRTFEDLRVPGREWGRRGPVVLDPVAGGGEAGGQQQQQQQQQQGRPIEAQVVDDFSQAQAEPFYPDDSEDPTLFSWSEMSNFIDVDMDDYIENRFGHDFTQPSSGS